MGVKWDDLPREIKRRMLDLQELQRNPRNEHVFIQNIAAGKEAEGITWSSTPEGDDFWRSILDGGKFDFFYTKHPKITRFFWMKPGDKMQERELILDLGPSYIDRYIVEDGFGDWDYFRYCEEIIEKPSTTM